MSEHHDHDTDPHIHRAQEADEPQSIERVPRGMPSGRVDEAGGQAGLQDVDRDRDLGSREVRASSGEPASSADPESSGGRDSTAAREALVDRGGWSMDDQASAGAIGGHAGTREPQGLAEGDTLGGTTDKADDPLDDPAPPDSVGPADTDFGRTDVRGSG